jgi:hypothetical protein
LSSNAQLHSLESYINADVHHALSFKKEHMDIVGPQNARSFPDASDSLEMASHGKGSLGVALIQPVTAGLEFSESRRELYPTKRSIFVNVEPVSTMLSFEDLNLIETVVARLSSSRSKDKARRKLNKASANRFPSESRTSKATYAVNETYVAKYGVTFTTQRLGLGLKTVEGQTIVNTIQNGQYEKIIHVGDAVLSVGGSDCSGCTLGEVVRRLAESDRPVTIQFGRPIPSPAIVRGSERSVAAEGNDIPGGDGEDNTENVAFSFVSFVVTMRKGVPSGLQLERSICGGLPVVSKVLPEFADAATESTGHKDADQYETKIATPIRFPRTGAVVASINGIPIAEMGLEDVWQNLTSMECISTDEGAVADSSGESMTYDLTFLEIDSKLWGTIESINISSSGFALSFIDDLNGRDMPLFRGRLDALQFRAERGIGARSQIIEVHVPSILKCSIMDPTSPGSVILSKPTLDQFRSESVLSLSAGATCSMDYFHPKVAFWEPLVEPSQLFLFLEKQKGNTSTGRAGQVAIELSDQLLRDQNFRSCSLPAVVDMPRMVTFNLTDASAEVAAQALSQWKAWRKSKTLAFDEEDQMGVNFDNGKSDGLTLLDRGSSSLVRYPSSAPKFNLDSERFGASAEIQQRPNAFGDAKRMAAQRAAQAALVFANKRGAERSRKSDSAKPFVLRNRTGVSIAFVQSDAQVQGRTIPSNESGEPNMAVVGEYQGLTAYSSSMIQELADKEDARFNMEVFSDQPGDESTRREATPSSRRTSNKVRTYEGRFPSLTIAIQAVAGIAVQPLRDLQVFKVGSTVRHLLVRKENSEDYAQAEEAKEYSIPVVWKVEIEDNRRVLTLSTAVRVVSTAFGTEMEIGVRPIVFDHSVKKSLLFSSKMTAIGTVRQDRPFYLPLWVALKLEAVNVFVRPKQQGSIHAEYNWGGSSILRFAPLNVDPRRYDAEQLVSRAWVWEETFEELDYIRCDTIVEKDCPLWVAVFSGSSPDGAAAGQHAGNSRRRNLSMKPFEEEHHEVISVTLDANVTLRNMLPMHLDWQVAHVAYGSSDSDIVDGSTIRAAATSVGRDTDEVSTAVLCSGECTEAFACDFHSTTLQARFREFGGKNWSDWAPLTLDELIDCEDSAADEDEESHAIIPRSRQVNVQVPDDSFGVPMTLGVRVVPKLTFGALGDASKAQLYGVEVIIYSELWIRNITSLPLNFGCPSVQVHRSIASASRTASENVTLFNAESALIEIASLLEVGEKGTGFDIHGAKGATAAGIESLPNQQCVELCEEVFEYLEIEYSTVKRRWWASDSYDSFRMNITQSVENGQWRWTSDRWVSTARRL